jgi:hypothetical protein
VLHLLDANVLITAHRLYYPLDRVPEFWEWLVQMGSDKRLKVPLEMIEEVCDGTDDLATWLSDDRHRSALQLDEQADVILVQHAINNGYAPDLNDQEIEILGRDPFLLAYALRDRAARCVVTTEVSKPRRLRANRHLPDVCNQLQITWMDSFGLVRALDFSTSWKSRKP